MTHHSTTDRIAFIAMLAGGVLIAFSPIFMRFATESSTITPTAAAFWRVGLALPFLFLGLMINSRRQSQAAGRDIFYMCRTNFIFQPSFLWVGFFFAADLAFWHWSIAFTTVANATLLANMASIFTAVIGFLFFKERFSRQFIFGLILAIIGAFALMGHSLTANPQNLLGDLLGLVTAAAYAGYIIATNKARKNWSTMELMFGSGIITTIILGGLTLMENQSPFPETLDGWWPLLGLSWLSHLLGQSMIMYGLAHLSATMGSVSLLIQPICAALLAAMIFGENLVIYHLIGGTLILTGILICRRGHKKDQKQKEAAIKTAAS